MVKIAIKKTMWYNTRRIKEVWWYTYDPLLPKVYLVLSLKKGKKETTTIRWSLNRWCSSNKTEKNVYPFICQFCKQYRKQDNNNNYFIETKLRTKDGEQTMKKAAQISEPIVDLIAKEFSLILNRVIWSSLNVCGLREN